MAIKLLEEKEGYNYIVIHVEMDVACRNRRAADSLDSGYASDKVKMYHAFKDFLKSKGYEMAGDYLDATDVTDVYRDNDYEFFTEAVESDEYKSYKDQWDKNYKGKNRSKKEVDDFITGAWNDLNSGENRFTGDEFKQLCKDAGVDHKKFMESSDDESTVPREVMDDVNKIADTLRSNGSDPKVDVDDWRGMTSILIRDSDGWGFDNLNEYSDFEKFFSKFGFTKFSRVSWHFFCEKSYSNNLYVEVESKDGKISIVIHDEEKNESVMTEADDDSKKGNKKDASKKDQPKKGKKSDDSNDPQLPIEKEIALNEYDEEEYGGEGITVGVYSIDDENHSFDEDVEAFYDYKGEKFVFVIYSDDIGIYVVKPLKSISTGVKLMNRVVKEYEKRSANIDYDEADQSVLLDIVEDLELDDYNLYF